MSRRPRNTLVAGIVGVALIIAARPEVIADAETIAKIVVGLLILAGAIWWL